MKIIKQEVQLIDEIDSIQIYKKLEKIGRVCWKSESKITEDSYKKFLLSIINKNHESVLEHVALTVKVITSKAITHEWVRHRIASYTQSSSRYIKYDDIEIILPVAFYNIDDSNRKLYEIWELSCNNSVNSYIKILEAGAKPELARDVLPNCCATTLYCTMNLRSLRHFLKLRTDKSAHPQIQDLAKNLLKQLKNKISIIFDDIN